MKKILKRILSLVIAGTMAMVMAVPAFAVEVCSAQGYSFSSVGNSSYQLNAYTEGTPSSGTKVTMWTNTGSDTQRWDPITYPGTSYYWFQNAANKSVVIAYNGNSQAVLTSKNSSTYGKNTQGIKMVDEGTDSDGYEKWGLVLPAYVLCLTASSYSNGGAANWQSSNGQNNQLWISGKYY